MKRLALLAGLLMAAAPAYASTADIQRVEDRIEALGVKVLWSDGAKVCRENGLLGMYVPSKRTVYMCQENLHRAGEPVLNTLQHEGWHAVQHVCNANNAALSDEKIRALVSDHDRHTIEQHYPKHQWRAEAEARALEYLPTDAYLNGVNHFCR